MGEIRQFEPVKPFAGILLAESRLLPEVRERLVALLGPIDHESDVLKFEFTDYYSKEMGDTLDRIFFSFENLLEAEALAGLKVETNGIETDLSSTSTEVARPVNIDPGYVESAKVILASTKNFYHRTYLGRGIFAEVTMHFRNKAFQFFPWTYPDYRSKDYQDFFLRVRQIYREQLKNRCQMRQDSG